MKANYPECYKAVRVFEGGNDDDPQDPGGRTSRGIIQREWDRYRRGKPELPADVWQAPEADIAAIYKGDYWLTQACDRLRSGIDETIFDYGVNSGVGRAPKVLRRCLHMPDDAPAAEVMARVDSLSDTDARLLIASINQERLAFLQSLRIWPRFGCGWAKRVRQVNDISLYLQAHPVATVARPQTTGDTAAKGQHPEPKTAKVIVKGGGAGTGAATGAWGWDWLQAHPVETALLALGAIAVIALVIGAINKWHQKRNEAPPKGWTPPHQLKPA